MVVHYGGKKHFCAEPGTWPVQRPSNRRCVSVLHLRNRQRPEHKLRDSVRQRSGPAVHNRAFPLPIATDDTWAETRESQALTATSVRNSCLAVTIDTGDPDNIHPKDSGWMSARASLSTSRVRSVGAGPKTPGPSANYLPGSNSLIASTYVVTLSSLMFEREETRTTEPSAPLADFTFFIGTRPLEVTDAGASTFTPLSC